LSFNITSPNYSNNDIAQVNWFPTTGLNCSDCIDPTVLTYDSYTEYTVTVYYNGDDNELCNATASTIIIVENNLALFIPNAFTPGNFDQINNQFEVYGEGIEYVTMQIFNRIGEKIFESSNQEVGWDGTFKGELQNPGVYTYFVSVEYLDGKVVDRKGSVSLIR
jgi:gliding motility-associated-like protein